MDKSVYSRRNKDGQAYRISTAYYTTSCNEKTVQEQHTPPKCQGTPSDIFLARNVWEAADFWTDDPISIFVVGLWQKNKAVAIFTLTNCFNGKHYNNSKHLHKPAFPHILGKIKEMNMPHITKKELCNICGLKSKNLSTYVSRGKLKMTESGLINDQDPVNIAFLEKYKSKAIARRVGLQLDELKNGIYIDFPDPEPDELTLSDELIAEMSKKTYLSVSDEIPETLTSIRLASYLKNVKTAKEIELLKLRAEKIKGEVIPLRLLAKIINRHHLNIQDALKDLSKTADSVSDLRQIAALNKASIKTRDELKNLLSDYFRTVESA